MASYGPDRAECLVYTFKEGLLSTVAHDLELRVTAFAIEVADDARSLEARFDARSLRVERNMHAGRPGSPPSARDRETIEANIAGDVLEARDFPEIRFRSTAITREGTQAIIEGTLTLHGRTRPITFRAVEESGRWVTEVHLHQPDYGIRPYSALLGTLRVQPAVMVRVTLPA